MVESSPSVDEDEIDLLELIRTLLQAWKTIVGITIVCVGLAVAYALNAPEVFKAETLLSPVQEEKSGTSSALSQFGGLAAMAGVTIPVIQILRKYWLHLRLEFFLKNLLNKKNYFQLFLKIFGM